MHFLVATIYSNDYQIDVYGNTFAPDGRSPRPQGDTGDWRFRGQEDRFLATVVSGPDQKSSAEASIKGCNTSRIPLKDEAGMRTALLVECET